MNTKTFRCFTTLLFASFFLIAGLQAQQNSCYVRLEDASGYTPTSEQLAELEAAACALIDSFPVEFRDSFRVYDFGFYLHQEVMEGGYPEPFAQKIQEVQALSPYYLLFGKQTDRSGVYTRFWVDLKLPNSNSFSCLDSSDRISLTLSIDLSVNIQYKSLENLPYFFHKAEISGINRIRGEIITLVECCYYSKGNNTCKKPCLNAEEIKLYFERNSFDVIDIKIIDSIQYKSNLKYKKQDLRVNDCANNSIEINGDIYQDLSYVINNILLCFSDSTASAVILNDSCFCSGGIDYINSIIFDDKIIIKIYLWRSPIAFGSDAMFIKYINSDFIGKLPFTGHIVKKINNEYINIDINYVKNTVINIYSKNGFSLSSIDFYEPPVLGVLDLYNEIRDYNVNGESSGYSNKIGPDLLSDKSNFIDYIYTVLKYKDKIITQKHRNYILGVHIAHEFMHQIVGKCIKYIQRSSNIQYFEFDDHCIDARNLMFPGDGGPYNNPSAPFPPFFTKEEKESFKNGYWYSLLVTKVYFPGEITPNLVSDWERVSPTIKFIVSLGSSLYKAEVEYGVNSEEFKCFSLIMTTKLQKLKIYSYEIEDH